MRKIFTTLAFIFSVYISVQAQTTSSVSGSVKDSQGQALPAATVSLLKTKDSSLVKIAVTDKDGKYEFPQVVSGSYVISVSSVGYEKRFLNTFQVEAENVSLSSTTLNPSTKDLNAVTVQAKKPFIEAKIDKTVINVDASPTSAGNSALEVLEKAPGVSVNNDGAVSLRGKSGVIVMLDGKPTYLSPTDLASLLRNMPATALDQIEIMTNPSSKFDASGNSGVINIKTKKGKNDGFNGNLTLGASSSIYKLDGSTYLMPKSQNSFNFNYRKSNINFFGSYNPNFFRGRNTMDINNKLIDSDDGSIKGYSAQQTKFKFGNFNQSLRLGLDWSVGKKDVVGIVAGGFLFNGRPTPVTVASLYDLNHQLETRLISQTNNDIRFKNFTGNLNWKHTYDSSGKELTADFDLVKYRNLSNIHLVTDAYNSQMVFKAHSEIRGVLPADIDIYSFKMDYVKPLKSGRLEAGVKTSYVKNDNNVDYDLNNGSGWVNDQIRSNHFIYNENINAAYVNVNQKVGKWTLQAGLRVENTQAEGNQVTTKQIFKRDTTNFFPTAFLSYALNQKNTFTISYGRRILRPNYQDLNPFIFFSDTLSYRQGNIFLKPQYTQNMDISHAYKGKFITTLSYNSTRNVISQIIKPKEGSGGKIRYITPDNVAQLRNIAFSVTAPISITKWWNSNISTNVFNNHYTGVYDTISINLAYTAFMLNVTNSFTLGKGFTGEISGFYRSKTIDQLTRFQPIYQMSFAVQKQVMEGKGTFRLNVRDPFAWQKFGGHNQYGFVDMHFLNRPDVRQVTATFSLRFGKNNGSNPPRRRASSSQEEQNRIGQGS